MLPKTVLVDGATFFGVSLGRWVRGNAVLLETLRNPAPGLVEVRASGLVILSLAFFWFNFSIPEVIIFWFRVLVGARFLGLPDLQVFTG